MRKEMTFVELMIAAIAIIVIAGFGITFVLGIVSAGEIYTTPERSRNTLEAQGFTDIQVGGYQWGACGRDDYYSTKFTAANPQGRRVSGVVCCGNYKGCTIRF
jgi:hypothetical protein